MEDAALLRKYAVSRDAESFAEIVYRYAGMVYGTCRRLTGDAHDAEDVAQECFLELARKAGTITTSLPGWLHKVAQRRTIDFIRKTSTRTRYEGQIMPETNNSKETAWEEIAPYIDDALESMPEKYRIPLIRHFLSGDSQEEIAKIIGMNQSTVSRRIEKGVKCLRTALKKGGVITSVTALTALLADNAFCSAPATLMTALGKMAIAGIGASAIAATTGSGIGTAVAVSTGTAVTSAGIIGFITAIKLKTVAVVVATTMIVGGVVLNKRSSAGETVEYYKHRKSIAPCLTPKFADKLKSKPQDDEIFYTVYKKDSKIIRFEYPQPFAKQIKIHSWSYQYDEHDRIKIAKYHGEDTAYELLSIYTVNEYNSWGLPTNIDLSIDRKRYGREIGNEKQQLVYKYDETGTLIELISLNNPYVGMVTIHIKYDENHNLMFFEGICARLGRTARAEPSEGILIKEIDKWFGIFIYNFGMIF